MEILEGALDDPQVIDLLRLHAEGMLANSPPESCHFLDLSELKAPGVTFWSAWDGERVAGMGALKELDPTHGEIKSMRAAPDYRGRGVGKLMLQVILTTAYARGYERLSLETGSGPEFAPALGLYTAHGFEPCGAFADYAEGDPFSRFMTLTL